ncbi:MAG: cyclic pyranopterin monophosphate synthase MoaC, partial [Gemmatimonadetes bacterium]|nr:cyclic pyranopterin monophosphate synthase MoaC [Gemmatimonadota bacterium]
MPTDPSASLSHLAADGSASMVDVSDKTATARRALAEGRIVMRP